MSKILGYFGQNKRCSLPATWVLIAITEPLKIPCAGKLVSLKVRKFLKEIVVSSILPKNPKNPTKLSDIYQDKMTSLLF